MDMDQQIRHCVASRVIEGPHCAEFWIGRLEEHCDLGVRFCRIIEVDGSWVSNGSCMHKRQVY